MYRKKQLVIISLLVIFLASCSSIPLGTMLRFRNASSDILKEIESENFRAKVTHQDSIIIKPEKSVFSLALLNDEKKESFEFPLKLVERETVKKGLFKRKLFAKTTLKMTDEGIADFVRLQKDAGKIESKYNSVQFNVNCYFDSVEKNKSPRHLDLTIEIKLNAQEDFFTLINSAKIDLGKTALKQKD